ncbi:MAG: hypothetical protein ACK4WS_08430, partial [Burkholderiales bacterium]
WPLEPAFVTPIAVFLLHPFGDLSKTEKTSLHHSFTAVSGGGNCRKEAEAELDAFDAMADSGHEVSASTDDNDDDF